MMTNFRMRTAVQHGVDLALIVEFCGDDNHRHALCFEVGSEASRVFFAPAMQHDVAPEISEGCGDVQPHAAAGACD